MSASSPRVVILCGGLGTRLKQETEFRPKPMIEVGGVPLLIHIMKIFSFYGFKSFVLALGFKGDAIRNYFINYKHLTSDFTLRFDRSGNPGEVEFHGDGEAAGWEVTLAETGPLTATGGRIHRLRPYVGDQSFFMTYGDGVADVDLRALLAHHSACGRVATVTGFRPLSRFGVIEADEGGTVRSFREKTRMDSTISGGFFVLEPEIFRYLDPDCVFEQGPLQALAEEDQLAVYNHEGFWKSVDTYREYLEINRMWDEGERPWALWEGRSEPDAGA